MTWTTGSSSRSGDFADGQDNGSSWVKAYGDGHKTREYASVLGAAAQAHLEAVPLAALRTGNRTGRWLLAAGALLAVVVALVLRTAVHPAGDAAAADSMSVAAVSWGPLGLGALCFVTLVGLVVVASRR